MTKKLARNQFFLTFLPGLASVGILIAGIVLGFEGNSIRDFFPFFFLVVISAPGYALWWAYFRIAYQSPTAWFERWTWILSIGYNGFGALNVLLAFGGGVARSTFQLIALVLAIFTIQGISLYWGIQGLSTVSKANSAD